MLEQLFKIIGDREVERSVRVSRSDELERLEMMIERWKLTVNSNLLNFL
jgi:hypothetical protein